MVPVMKPKQAILGLSVVLGVSLVAVPRTSAHHSRAGFDLSRNITFQGVVKDYRLENPHSALFVTVSPDAKNPSIAGTWYIEASSVDIMIYEGWNRMTYKPGDAITVVAHPMKNGRREALLFYAVKPDGTGLYRAQHRYDSETE
jgi:Family of unknown function (DUF6152)